MRTRRRSTTSVGARPRHRAHQRLRAHVLRDTRKSGTGKGRRRSRTAGCSCSPEFGAARPHATAASRSRRGVNGLQLQHRAGVPPRRCHAQGKGLHARRVGQSRWQHTARRLGQAGRPAGISSGLAGRSSSAALSRCSRSMYLGRAAPWRRPPADSHRAPRRRLPQNEEGGDRYISSTTAIHDPSNAVVYERQPAPFAHPSTARSAVDHEAGTWLRERPAICRDAGGEGGARPGARRVVRAGGTKRAADAHGCHHRSQEPWPPEYSAAAAPARRRSSG